MFVISFSNLNVCLISLLHIAEVFAIVESSVLQMKSDYLIKNMLLHSNFYCQFVLSCLTLHYCMICCSQLIMGCLLLIVQVAEPLRAMVMGAPLEDARHLAQRYDRMRQEAEAQVYSCLLSSEILKPPVSEIVSRCGSCCLYWILVVCIIVCFSSFCKIEYVSKHIF